MKHESLKENKARLKIIKQLKQRVYEIKAGYSKIIVLYQNNLLTVTKRRMQYYITTTSNERLLEKMDKSQN